VIVHTANLLEEDLTLQTNGAFIQDFFLKSKGKSDSSDTTKIPDFEQTLISYMNTYGYSQTRRWSTQRDEPEMTLSKQLSLFNFSSAKAVLIPSSPGYYKLVHDECHHQGYLKVKRSIEKYVGSNSKSALSAYGPVVCQFSSIGAISEKWLREFVGSLSVPVAKKHRPLGNLVDAVKLVWPTGKEIQSSVQGIGGGGSVPGRLKNLSKPFLNPLYCKWSCNTSNPIFKGRNVPHIKTYYQLNSDDSFAWFMLGSHNLSKAAWGEVINGRYGQCLRVNSWELGVFMCPNLLANETESVVLSPVGVDSNPRTAATIPIPLPYNCRPKHYQSVDAPWHVGILE
jgi:tyrosyl-DNA phosphodiesterase-1